MRKLVMLLWCAVFMAVAALPVAAYEADDIAAAKDAGLKYYTALVNADAEAACALMAERFLTEYNTPGEVMYSHMTAMLKEGYAETLRAMAAKTSFEFVSAEEFDGRIDVMLEAVVPNMEYISTEISSQVQMTDEELAVVVGDMLKNPKLPMEKYKVELEMVSEGGAWKVKAHTDFVGEPL